jgi:sugar phosphate isomerase/epimerase
MPPERKMTLGWCAPLAKAALVQRTGYDYLEVPLADFGLEDQASLAAAKRAVDTAPLPLTVFNWFYPQHMRVVGPSVDAPRVKSYLRRGAELMHHAGAKAAVLGSAWARNVREGEDRSAIERQLLESYSWVADAFAGSGVVVGIEAQNRKEANIVTCLAEAVAYAEKIGRPDTLRVMADFYHMDEEREPLSDLAKYAGWIAHVQLADSSRLNPGTGSYDYERFFAFLNQGGYRGTVSVECMVPISEQGMRESQTFLRRWTNEPARP